MAVLRIPIGAPTFVGAGSQLVVAGSVVAEIAGGGRLAFDTVVESTLSDMTITVLDGYGSVTVITEDE